VTLKKGGLSPNTVLHNVIIIAQFCKRNGRSGITRQVQLPERISRRFPANTLRRNWPSLWPSAMTRKSPSFSEALGREKGPVPVRLANILERHPQTNGSAFMFPSATGNREQNMLRLCKEVAERAGLDPAAFDLKTHPDERRRDDQVEAAVGRRLHL
jgi:hypothetical protein